MGGPLGHASDEGSSGLRMPSAAFARRRAGRLLLLGVERRGTTGRWQLDSERRSEPTRRCADTPVNSCLAHKNYTDELRIVPIPLPQKVIRTQTVSASSADVFCKLHRAWAWA